MPDRKGAPPPRAGRYRRSSAVGAKARCYPSGAARHRLWGVIRPTTLDDRVLAWLLAGPDDPTGDGRGRPG